MAAKLASNQGGARSGGERQEAGPCQSYASVLNPKGASQSRASSFKSNNKENIGEQVTGSQQHQQSQQQQQATIMVERLMPSMVKDESCQRTARCQATRMIQPISDNFPEKDNHYERKPNAHVVDSRQDDGQRDVAGQLNNGNVSNDGEFQTVANKGARRKEKMREQHRETHRERHRLRENNNRHQQQPRGPIGVGGGSGGGGVGRRGSDERAHRERSDRNGVAEHSGSREAHHYRDDQNVEAETQPVPLVPSLVKYVEAPLPAVNPWTKNKTPTSQAAKTSQQQALNVVPAAATSTCLDRQSDGERRVLQPQQHRDTIGELRYSFNVQGFRRGFSFLTDSLRSMRAKLTILTIFWKKLFMYTFRSFSLILFSSFFFL